MSEDALKSSEQLEAILYQYVNLYERWSEDRQSFAKKGAELTALIETVESAVHQLEDVELRLKRLLSQRLEQIAEEVKTTLMKATTVTAKESLRQTTQHLQQVVVKTDRVLNDSREEITKGRWRWFAVTLVSAVLSSVVLAHWVLPANLHPLTPRQVASMQLGASFLVSLNHLPKPERDRLMKRLAAVQKRETL